MTAPAPIQRHHLCSHLGARARQALRRRWLLPSLLLVALLGVPSWCSAAWVGIRIQPAGSRASSLALHRRGASVAASGTQDAAAAGEAAEEVAEAGTDEEAAEASNSGGGSGMRSGLSSRLRDRLAAEIAAQESQAEKVPTEDQKRIVRQEVDLNGVDPLTCILGSIPTAALSYGFWTFTGSAAEWFVTHPIETDFYPAQRLGTVFQTAMVGLSSLAAGIFGFTALGIFLLGLRVAAGVASGELDPSKQSDEPVKPSTAERVRDILTKDPVDVVMAERRRKASSS